MLKIGILQLGYETNTFLAGRGELKDLGTGDWIPADRLVSEFEGGHAAVSGAIHAIRQMNAEPVGLPSMSRAGAFNAGPLLSKACVEQAMDHICQYLSHTDLDGLYFAMHGASCAEGYADADGYFLRRLRQVVGDMPIMCSLDLHANMTEEMVQLADGLFGIKEYPHTDYYEAGYLAAKTLVKTLQGAPKPQMALKTLPLLISTTAGCTLDSFASQLREHFKAFAEEKKLLDASFFHGFSCCDSPHTHASVLTVAHFNPVPATETLAQWVLDRKEHWKGCVYSAEEAIDQALSLCKSGYTVIAEGSDNPGSGCPGDGTHLLTALMARNIPGSVMGPLYDPEAAAICHSHTVGDRFSLTFGGKTDPTYGQPITDQVTLLNLCDGTFQCATPVHKGAVMCYGPTARIRSGNVEVILVSNRFQTYDDRPFIMTGADMSDYRLVALKSTVHFRAYFGPLADGIVLADTPSTNSADLRSYSYKNIERPIYPLEEEV